MTGRARPVPFLLLTLSILAATACGTGSDRAAAGHLVVTGSSTVAPLMNEIARRFEGAHPGLRVDVQTGGSARGLADARQGLADIGMVSRDPRAGEDDLSWHPIARDGVALIVHRDNPLAAIDRRQVVAVYTGGVGDWSALGGRPAPITVVHKAEGRSTLEVFLRHFDLDNRAVVPDVVIGDNQQGIKTVAGNPHAIGYVSIGAAEIEAARGTPIKLLAVDGVEATVANVENGTFPLVRTLHLVTRGTPHGAQRALIDFARSPGVHDLARAQSFVPLRAADSGA